MGGTSSSRWDGHDRRRCIGEGTIELSVLALAALTSAPVGRTGTLVWGSRLSLRAATRTTRELPGHEETTRELILSTSDDRQRLGVLGLSGYRAPYGGVRWWLSCPECAHNRRALYCLAAELGPAGSQVPFRCRQCAGLAYRSQGLSELNRLEQRCHRIAVRMGHGEAWYRDNTGSPPKPKGMHWRTWGRHNQQLDAAEARQNEVWVRQICRSIR